LNAFNPPPYLTYQTDWAVPHFSGRPVERSLFDKGRERMTRMTLLSNPLLLGFEEIERMIERAGKSPGGGYPPYNIERIAGDGQRPEVLRITLAVAGFTRDDLDVTLEDKQLIVRGKAQDDDQERDFLYRGIAARQFNKAFLLADGIEVRAADLQNGLLSIDLVRHEPERLVRKIEIGSEKKGR
jgi:HSP20 family molecular chaperone IbpA